MPCELDDYRWLTSNEAQPYLHAAATMDGSPATVARLRRQLSPCRTHLVMEQAELRRRAKAKFPAWEQMFFTRRGLEQATDQTVAAYKARRIAEALSPTGIICDLCCGIGGDLVALAHAAQTAGAKALGASVLGVDADPVVAHLAAANARGLGGETAVTVVTADVTGDVIQSAVRAASVWHIDPDRRPGGHRRTHLEAFSPSLEHLEKLLTLHPAAAIKLAPASQVPAEWAQRMECEWIGFHGECRQQVAWGGPLAHHPGQRTATVLDGTSARTVVGSKDAAPAVATAPAAGQFLFEPHAAVLAAGLADVLAAEHGLLRLAEKVSYFTGDHPVDDPALAAFEVLEAMPLKPKEIGRWLADRGLGRVEVKKRAVSIDPLKLQKQLQGNGDGSATILIGPGPKRTTAYITRRVSAPTPW